MDIVKATTSKDIRDTQLLVFSAILATLSLLALVVRTMRDVSLELTKEQQ